MLDSGLLDSGWYNGDKVFFFFASIFIADFHLWIDASFTERLTKI